MLSRAIAVSSSSRQLAMIAGPAIGGRLYPAGSGVVYACSATLFLFSAALMLAVVERRVRMVLPPLSLDYVFAGLRFIAGRPARKDSACCAPPLLLARARRLSGAGRRGDDRVVVIWSNRFPALRDRDRLLPGPDSA